MKKLFTRRAVVTTGLATAAGASGVAAAAQYGLIPPDYNTVFGLGETLTYAAQRLVTSDRFLAREFKRSDITDPVVNGPAPIDEAFKRLAADGFKDWRLEIEGMVANPASFSLEELKAMPQESHIILHACEQGWSYIAEWTGVRLSHVLDMVKTRPEARYILFKAYPNPNQVTGEIRELSDIIDMADALHPQTLLAYGMNGEAMPADHGAPLRIRMSRQLGYRNTKYLYRMIVTDRMDLYRKGLGTWHGGI